MDFYHCVVRLWFELTAGQFAEIELSALLLLSRHHVISGSGQITTITWNSLVSAIVVAAAALLT